jgi:hypothetical protein
MDFGSCGLNIDFPLAGIRILDGLKEIKIL